MPRSSTKRPSFFKVLSNTDFTKLLRVAPAFFGRYGLTPPENVKLRVHSGRRWNVKVERLDNGLFCFTRGWRSFARHSALQLGEFLVFSLVEESEFNVSIYDTSCCEREIPVPPARVKPELDAQSTNMSNKSRRGAWKVANGASRRSGSYREEESDPLYFEICLQKHQRSRINLRKNFLDGAGLRGKKSVVLEYVGRRSCTSVAVDQQQRYRVDLARGWNEFRKMNGLECGKTYSFRFNPERNVIHVDQVV